MLGAEFSGRSHNRTSCSIKPFAKSSVIRRSVVGTFGESSGNRHRRYSNHANIRPEVVRILHLLSPPGKTLENGRADHNQLRPNVQRQLARRVVHLITIMARAGTICHGPALHPQMWREGSGCSRRTSPSELVCEHAPQFPHGLTDDPWQLQLTWFADPAREGDLEDGGPGLGGQARGRLSDTAVAERAGHRRSERRELDQLAFPEFRVRGHDRSEEHTSELQSLRHLV